MAWKSICKPLNQGGLEIRSVEEIAEIDRLGILQVGGTLCGLGGPMINM